MTRLRRRLVVAFYRWLRARRSKTTVYWNAQDVIRTEATGELVAITAICQDGTWRGVRNSQT